MRKKAIVFFLGVFIGLAIILYQLGFRIPKPNDDLEGNIVFLGTENKNGYIMMEEHGLFVLYEYQQNTLTPIGTYQNIEAHLLHDEILEITKESNDHSYVFTRFYIETRVRRDIYIDTELGYFLHQAGNVEVIDDNDDVIILYQEVQTIIDNLHHSTHFVYVIDKELNEVTKRYNLSDYGTPSDNVINEIYLENQHIIYITNQSQTTEDIVYINYEDDSVLTRTEDSNPFVHYIFDKYCLVSKDHRLNNTCRTIPEEHVDDVLTMLRDTTGYNDILFDTEYVYFIYDNTIETYRIDGNKMSTITTKETDIYLMFDDQEIMYIYEELQQFILERLVFKVVVLDPVENNELEHSTHFVIKTD